MVIEQPIKCTEKRAMDILAGELAEKTVVSGIEHFLFCIDSVNVGLTVSPDGLVCSTDSESYNESLGVFKKLHQMLEEGNK